MDSISPGRSRYLAAGAAFWFPERDQTGGSMIRTLSMQGVPSAKMKEQTTARARVGSAPARATHTVSGLAIWKPKRHRRHCRVLCLHVNAADPVAGRSVGFRHAHDAVEIAHRVVEDADAALDLPVPSLHPDAEARTLAARPVGDLESVDGPVLLIDQPDAGISGTLRVDERLGSGSQAPGVIWLVVLPDPCGLSESHHVPPRLNSIRSPGWRTVPFTLPRLRHSCELLVPLFASSPEGSTW